MIPPNSLIRACFRMLCVQINKRLPERNDDRATLSRTASQPNPGMVSSIAAALEESSAANMPSIRPARPRSAGRGICGTGYQVGGHSLALLADVGRARTKRQPRTPLNSEKTTVLRHHQRKLRARTFALASASHRPPRHLTLAATTLWTSRLTNHPNTRGLPAQRRHRSSSAAPALPKNATRSGPWPPDASRGVHYVKTHTSLGYPRNPFHPTGSATTLPARGGALIGTPLGTPS